MNTTRVNLSIHGVDATRWIYAREAAEKHEAARRFLGVDADIYRILRLRDKRGERPDLVAYGVGLEGGDVLVCLDAPGARPMRLPAHRIGEVFGDLELERDPDQRHYVRDRFSFAFRNESWSGSIERYEPLTEAERDRRRESAQRGKQTKADRKWREANPLFAQIGGGA